MHIFVPFIQTLCKYLEEIYFHDNSILITNCTTIRQYVSIIWDGVCHGVRNMNGKMGSGVYAYLHLLLVAGGFVGLFKYL